MVNLTEEILSSSIQDYLKTIYLLTRDGQPTSTVALADALDIRPASVTNMLQRLVETQPELINYQKYQGVTLTPEGEKTALQIIRNHRLIEQFLYQVLEYPLEKLHPEAEKLEHVVSPYFIEQIVRLMGDPAFDPHGHPIPDLDLNLNDPRNLMLLSDLQPGQKGIIRQISNQNPEVLKYLYTIGFQPSSVISVIQLNPIDGTQQITTCENDETHVLGEMISTSIYIEVIK